jgi:hypothetical protein
MSDHTTPAWETVCYPEREKLPRRATDVEKQKVMEEQKAEDARRIAALTDWVLGESLRQAAENSDGYERFMFDPTYHMRADELDAVRSAITSPADRGRLMAAALRQSPTEALLEIVAQLLESGAFTNRSQPSEELTLRQIEFVQEREEIKRLLLHAYQTSSASQTDIARRATEVAKLICGMTANEAKKAKEQYKDNFTRNAELRWILLTKTIARRK